MLTFLSEMKKLLIFTANLLVCVGLADAAVRDGTATARSKSDKKTVIQTQNRVSTTTKQSNRERTTVLSKPRTTTARPTSTKTQDTTQNARAAKKTVSRTPVKSGNTTGIKSRAASTPTNTSVISETRTGAEYEQCKNTYFSCMDQFCTLKNDDYRRCSCNDRVFALTEKRNTLQSAKEQLTEFNENLAVVGMTAQQATAMRTESDGEAALTDDKSASKALLQAIMNSIRGDDTNVGGKYSELNSINIAFDTVNAFGMTDVGQAIAAYNGQALYNAVYPQCRQAVKSDCNDASLQRAITAYLMAIEQDCNTVQTAIETTQKQMKSATRESSAMLDLARVENRQKHNSSDITTCINEVEAAILSEEVCGANYHKCLDNGQFIDITTGKAIAGVKNFYELEKLLVFSDGIDAASQKLAKNPSNRIFVSTFEQRTKKFAEPALDKCVENADVVWAEYLDKAMLDIYYAQKSKVSDIKQGCFDFIATCYMNGENAITAAMKELAGDIGIVLQPNKITLSSQMCTDYVESCNNMFDKNIIAEYIKNQKQTDIITACRAVAKQCFDKYGGLNYENFYYPYSGLFDSGKAADWFTLYDIKKLDNAEYDTGGYLITKDIVDGKTVYKYPFKSKCATQLYDVDACKDYVEEVFGGFDIAPVNNTSNNNLEYTFNSGSTTQKYGIIKQQELIKHRNKRPTGVATEVYNQILSVLSTQCQNLNGRFVEPQHIKKNMYDETNYCISQFSDEKYETINKLYFIGKGENMCPRDYGLGVDTQSWGACLCWENGARRSKWGKSAKCVNAIPAKANTKDATCAGTQNIWPDTDNMPDLNIPETSWCTHNVFSTKNQLCPRTTYIELKENDNTQSFCTDGTNQLNGLPEGII